MKEVIFDTKYNINKTTKFGRQIYEVIIEDGCIKMRQEDANVVIGFTPDYIERSINLINHPDVAYTRIENHWYGNGKDVKFYARDGKGISQILGWVDFKLKFLFKKNQSPLSPTEKV